MKSSAIYAVPIGMVVALLTIPVSKCKMSSEVRATDTKVTQVLAMDVAAYPAISSAFTRSITSIRMPSRTDPIFIGRVRARDGDCANTANSHWRQRRAVAVSGGGSFELAGLIERAGRQCQEQ